MCVVFCQVILAENDRINRPFLPYSILYHGWKEKQIKYSCGKFPMSETTKEKIVLFPFFLIKNR